MKTNKIIMLASLLLFSISSVNAANINTITPLDTKTIEANLTQDVTLAGWELSGDIKVLKDVGRLETLISKLDTKADWSNRLSPGQQQRISFARALLIQPDWLFLDETTASLDNQSEHDMYSLLKRKLKDTTLVSIAHRDSVEQFHDRVVSFNGVDNNGFIVCTDSKSTYPDEFKPIEV